LAVFEAQGAGKRLSEKQEKQEKRVFSLVSAFRKLLTGLKAETPRIARSGGSQKSQENQKNILF